MNDMRQVIVPKSDQINADDLISGPMTITIREVAIRGGQEQPVSIYFEGSDKAFRPCKSMSRVLVAAWGPDASVYVGRSLTLYRDPDVKWAGMAVGGIRISHMSHIEDAMTMALTATKGSRKPHRVQPLRDAPKPSGGARQTPQQWADEHIADIAAARDSDALTAVLNKGAKARAKLAADYPDLLAKIELAISQARANLDNDDPFTGPADTQRGERQSLADVEQAIAKAETVEAVNAVMRAAKDDLADEDYDTALGLANERIGELS